MTRAIHRTSELRAAFHGRVATVRQLVDFGFSERTVYKRCLDGGPWQRILPGVVLLFTGWPTRDQQVLAALLLCGPDAVVTGVEACRRHGIRRGPARQVADTRTLAEVHVLIPDDRQIRSVGFAHAEPLKVLADLRDEVRSAAEQTAKALWRGTGLPDPWWNATVTAADGRFLGIADCWLDDVGMVWEIESSEWHLSPADHDRTVDRAAGFTAAGAVYIGSKPKKLTTDRAGITALLRATYEQANARPRPSLRAHRPHP